MATRDNEHSPQFRTEKVGQAQANLAGCVLYVSGGADEDKGQRLILESGTAIVGSGERADLVLHDASVSRRHVEFSVVPQGVMVRDTGSTNGTFYLGAKIDQMILRTGVRLLIGRCEVDVLPLGVAETMPISERTQYDDLLGTSMCMRKLFTLLERLEGTDASVLIQGETGTGKELVAQALHAQGLRQEKPFIIVDCGNVPNELLESELFGHRKGSFTGALEDRVGAFEAADGGTLFLDEIGELPLDLQPKLLRALESGQIKPVGEAQHKKVDVRILAATHRDLYKMVAEESFREDLFYRLAVIRVSCPPLRERRDDILPLARYLAKSITHGAAEGLSPEAENALLKHDWPGNIRELRNVVQRVLALGSEGLLNMFGAGGPPAVGVDPQALQTANMPTIDSSEKYSSARRGYLDKFERAYMVKLLDKAGGNVSEAARQAGIDRKHIRAKIEKHELEDLTRAGQRKRQDEED
jgi:DNA-binding NtrC family response regulator